LGQISAGRSELLSLDDGLDLGCRRPSSKKL